MNFVKNGSKSWALIRRRLVLRIWGGGEGGGKTYGIGRPKGSREKGPLAQRLESSTPLAPIALSRSHIHINGVRVLAVGI